MDRPPRRRGAQGRRPRPAGPRGRRQAPRPGRLRATSSATWRTTCRTARSTPSASRSAPASSSRSPPRTRTRFARIVVAGVGANLFRTDTSGLVAAAIAGEGDPANPVVQYFAGLAAQPGADREALAACIRSPRPPLDAERARRRHVPGAGRAGRSGLRRARRPARRGAARRHVPAAARRRPLRHAQGLRLPRRARWGSSTPSPDGGRPGRRHRDGACQGQGVESSGDDGRAAGNGRPPADPRWRIVLRRVVVAVVVLAQLALVARGYCSDHKEFAFQMFPESSTWRAEIVRVDGRRRPGADRPGVVGLPVGRAGGRGGAWTDPELRHHADAGLDNQLAFLDAALDWVAANTPRDDETRYLEATVTMWHNTDGPEVDGAAQRRPRTCPDDRPPPRSAARPSPPWTHCWGGGSACGRWRCCGSSSGRSCCCTCARSSPMRRRAASTATRSTSPTPPWYPELPRGLYGALLCGRRRRRRWR